MRYRHQYAGVDDAAIWSFVGSQSHGRLVTYEPAAAPLLGIYPFVAAGGVVEMHFAEGDPQLDQLRAHPAAVFEVDEPLAFVPSHFSGDDSAMHADLYYRFVSMECDVALDRGEGAVREHLERLLGRYQPEGRFRALTEPRADYAGAMRRLTCARLTPRTVTARYKLGQQDAPPRHAQTAEALRLRGTPIDVRTAAVLDTLPPSANA